jgi:hypothetical protein
MQIYTCNTMKTNLIREGCNYNYYLTTAVTARLCCEACYNIRKYTCLAHY